MRRSRGRRPIAQWRPGAADDADPQATALDWSVLRQGEPAFPVIGLPKPVLHREMPALAAGYDHVIIDGPPQVGDVTRSAIMASDLAIIPVQPSGPDVWGARAVVELLVEAVIVQPKLKTAFAVSRKIVNTALGRDVLEALAIYRMHVPAAVLRTSGRVRRTPDQWPDSVRPGSRQHRQHGSRRVDA